MATERLRVILEMVTGQYTRAASDAANATSKISGQADKATTATGRITQEMDRMGKVAKTAVAGAAAAAFIGFAKDSARAASDLNESVNAVNQIFGDASDTVLEFGKIAAQTSGLSQREFNQLATNTGALLTNMGFSFQDAGDESIRLAQRAADLASVFNTDVSDALNAINSGLRGETEPLRRYGVQLSDAEIRAKAVALGLADTTAAVDQNGKAVAALELIYEQTAKVQGDFIRTSDEVANAQRTLAAEFENTQARFGQATLAPKNFFLSAGADFLAGLNLLGVFGADAKAAQREAFLFEDAVYAINEAVRDGGQPLDRLADGLATIAQEGNLTTAQFESLAIVAGLSRDQFADFGRIVLEQGRALGLSEEVLQELEDAILGVGDAADDAEPEVEQLGEASRIAAQYLADAAQSQAEFNDLLGVFTTDGAPNAAAWLEEIGLAAFNSVDDVLKLKAAMEGANFAAAELAGAPIFEGVRTIGGGGGTGPQARAHGGPVSAGELYRVGEGNRPEMLMIPGDNGRVFSNAEMRSLFAASQAAGDQNIQITVPDAATAYQAQALFASNRSHVRSGLRGGAR